ncbi:MAG: hypothetical protein LBF71_05530 [Campylobacteraceae bacterium]|jgi:hypothetical protein|nr:hypothetical protein [Campylobacteraceae bacterium]
MSLIDTLKKDMTNVLMSAEVSDLALFKGAYGEKEVKAVITMKSEITLNGISAVEASAEFLECLSESIIGVKVNDIVEIRGRSYFVADVAPTIYGMTLIYISKDKLR